jgi:hypothetical protein
MDYPKITKLYKYTPFSSRSISALVTGKLWFPKPNTFNDPFDCKIVDQSKGLLSSLRNKGREFTLSMHNLRPPEFEQGDIEKKIFSIHDRYFTNITERDIALARMSQDAFATLQSKIYDFGILSLSATPRNILMWSHYGAHHTGICFEFERHENNMLGTDAKPVTYSRFREINDKNPTDETQDLFFVKYRGWRYEREWRLLATKGDQLYEFPGKLTSVICGARMPEQDIEVITMIADSINGNRGDKISVRYARMSEKHYSISICSRRLTRKL